MINEGSGKPFTKISKQSPNFQTNESLLCFGRPTKNDFEAPFCFWDLGEAIKEKNDMKLLGYPGLEPGTNRLKAEYSTIELATRKKETKREIL